MISIPSKGKTMSTTPTIGLCPACESDAKVRINGTAAKHKGPDAQHCNGSGRPVAAILPLTFRRWLSTQTNRRGHGLDLYVGTVARHAAHYSGEWSTAEELAYRMGANGVHAESQLIRYLVEADAAFDAFITSVTPAYTHNA